MEAYQSPTWGKTEWGSSIESADGAEWTPWYESSNETEWMPAEFDELTDCAERIRAPLDHQLYFDLEDGDLHCNTASAGSGLKEIAATALQISIEATQRDPRWAIEALRRRIEYDEITQVLDMPDGQMLVLSPTPDTVIDNDWDIGVGYNLTKKSIMLRLWKRAGDEFACRYISLNGGHKAGLTAGLDALDQPQPDGTSSEDWLRGRWYFPPDIDVASEMITAYDSYLQGKFGGNWSYGAETITEASALTLVSKWPDLLQAHMAKLRTATTPAEKEILRYNYAAAIEARRTGNFDVSMESAGDIARMNGEDFSGYCETIGVENNVAAIQELGFGRKTWMRCPYCGGSVFGDPCSPGTCPHCGSAPGQPAKNLDADLENPKRRSQAALTSTPPSSTKFETPKTEVKPPKEARESIDDLATEALPNRKWHVVRSGVFNGIEALVDSENGEVIAIGLKAKKLEYIRQEQEMTWLKVA